MKQGVQYELSKEHFSDKELEKRINLYYHPLVYSHLSFYTNKSNITSIFLSLNSKSLCFFLSVREHFYFN